VEIRQASLKSDLARKCISMFSKLLRRMRGTGQAIRLPRMLEAK
jgi:hypothetical protein